MDGSLNMVTLPELGSLELPLQLCRISQVPLFGRYVGFFFQERLAQIGVPGGHRPHYVSCSYLPCSNRSLFFLGLGSGLCDYTHGHVTTSRTVGAFLLPPSSPLRLQISQILPILKNV